MSNDEIPIPAGIPNVAGVDAPEGFTRNYVTIFKSYFCKYACDKEWDSFYEPDVLMNEELRNNAKAVFNERTEEEFHNALYDNDADYAHLVRYVVDCLVRQGLLREERKGEGNTVYWRTDKMKALCPEIIRVGLPVIDDLVRKYDSRSL
jgi:hypothetical protein